LAAELRFDLSSVLGVDLIDLIANHRA